MKITTPNALLLVCILFIVQEFLSCQKDNSYSNRLTANSNDNSVHTLPVDSSLVLWLPFTKGSLRDMSGHHNNVVFCSATPTASRVGRDSTAYYFDGQSSYMEVKSRPSFNQSGSITLAVLVKPMGFYAGPCHGNVILTKEDNGNANGRMGLGFDDEPYKNNGCNKPVRETREYFYGTYGNGAGASGARDTDHIRVDRWYDLVYTYDGSFSKLYVNGILKWSVNMPTSFTPNNFPLYIGKTQNPLFPYYFNGILDEIRIYNRALSPDEILNLDGKMGSDN
jgi:hypothetical protein